MDTKRSAPDFSGCIALPEFFFSIAVDEWVRSLSRARRIAVICYAQQPCIALRSPDLFCCREKLIHYLK